MTVTLDTLELTPAELENCRDAVRHIAYFNWLDAGCPPARPLDSWLFAERQWIEHFFVPNRPCDGTRPSLPPDATKASVAGGDKSLTETHQHEQANA